MMAVWEVRLALFVFLTIALVMFVDSATDKDCVGWPDDMFRIARQLESGTGEATCVNGLWFEGWLEEPYNERMWSAVWDQRNW